MWRRFSLVGLLLLSACLWRSYETILAVHVDVLSKTADKLADVVASEQGLKQGVAEYVYPAKRARQFLQQFSKYSARSSYVKLGAFLDRYEQIINDVDAARPGSNIDVDKVQREVKALREAVEPITRAAKAGD